MAPGRPISYDTQALSNRAAQPAPHRARAGNSEGRRAGRYKLLNDDKAQFDHGDADSLRTLSVELHRDFQSLKLFAEYGDMCLVMSMALTQIFAHHGVTAVVKSCNLVIAHEHGAFLHGFQEPNAKVHPDTIDAHAVCVADERLLLDFGLGYVQKTWNVPVHDAAIAPFTPNSAVLATHFSDRCAYVWMGQPRHNPRVRAVTEHNRALAQTIFERWQSSRNAPYSHSRFSEPSSFGAFDGGPTVRAS